MRFKDAQGALTNAHLVALIDAWPPAIIQKLKLPSSLRHCDLELGFCAAINQLGRTTK